MPITAILLSFFAILNLFLLWRLWRINNALKRVRVASKAKSLFMQKLSYEFRNPLNGIIGFSEMLESGCFGELSTKQTERIHDIYTCAKQLHDLVKDLIDLSKGEAGTIEMVETATSLSTLIGNAVDSLNNKIALNNVRVLMDLGQDCEIIGDQNKLLQAFKHIIDNAVKFSIRGGQVTITRSIIQDGFLRISIADSGIGMSSDEAGSIMLFPGDDRKVIRSDNGPGIGMPLASLFISLHQGEIVVESENGIGTTIIVSLPISRVRCVSA